MTSEGVEEIASHCIPDFGSFVEGTSTNSVSKGDIKAHTIYCIFMAFERVDQGATGGIPKFAGPIVAAGNELVSVLVEVTVGERQHVATKFL